MIEHDRSSHRGMKNKTISFKERPLLKVLEPIWCEKSETVSRVRSRVESVLSWATGYSSGLTVPGFRSTFRDWCREETSNFILSIPRQRAKAMSTRL